MNEPTPASLLERLRSSGNPDAWNRFVDLYVPLLRRWAARLGADGPDSDDLIQDVLVALVRTLPAFRYDQAGRFRGWLWTVTANKWREFRRRAAARPPAATAAFEPDAISVPDPAEEADEAEYHRYLVGRAVQLMQAEFEPTTWRAFLDTVTEDLPAAEVAARLGITVAAVYAAKARVLRRVRHELEGLVDWE